MTTIVAARRTGVGTGDVSIAFSLLLSQPRGLPAVSMTLPQGTRAEWLRARIAASVEWTQRAERPFSWTREASVRAASVAAVLWANETGWGANEWNWNVAGMHCQERDAECVRFQNDSRDPSLTAYSGCVDGVSAFWALVRERYEQMLPEFSFGQLSAVRGLQASGWTPEGSRMTRSELVSIYTRVHREGFSDAGRLELVSPERQQTGAGEGGARRGRAGGVLLMLAAAAALAASRE